MTRAPRQHESEDISEIVSGVSQQGQRMAYDAEDDLRQNVKEQQSHLHLMPFSTSTLIRCHMDLLTPGLTKSVGPAASVIS